MKKIIKGFFRSFGYTIVPIPVHTVEEDTLSISKEQIERFMYKVIHLHRYAPWLTDEKFKQLFDKIEPYTLVDIYRCYELFDIVQRLNNIDGDII